MIAAVAADQELVHGVESQRLIEDMVVDAVIGLVDSSNGWDVRNWEHLLAYDGCSAWRLNLHA